MFCPDACNFIKKEALAQVFFCEFFEISKNIFFTEHLQPLLLEASVFSPKLNKALKFLVRKFEIGLQINIHFDYLSLTYKTYVSCKLCNVDFGNLLTHFIYMFSLIIGYL